MSMPKAIKEVYTFKGIPPDKSLDINIYVDKADAVYYIGIEDTPQSPKNIDFYILFITSIMMNKYDIKPENIFVFQWFNKYKNRGIEIIEFEWDGEIPGNPSFKKFCEYKDNPFI